MRHAIAPGFDDPPNFQIGDCSTQRNLSDEGRQQAREIGEQFRANGINRVRVFSSQWCRCLETARLLELGPVQELPVLNSFFRKFKRQESQTRALKEWLAQQDLAEPLVLVTHQVNITALTKVTPAPGEVVIVKQTAPGEFLVVGTFQTD
jgi:phosphohistidine phosphatase SixA